MVVSARSLDAPLTFRGSYAFAASRAPSSFSGLRKITSRINPGTATRQVTTNNRGQPINGPSSPAIAPVTFRG